MRWVKTYSIIDHQMPHGVYLHCLSHKATEFRLEWVEGLIYYRWPDLFVRNKVIWDLAKESLKIYQGGKDEGEDP